MRRAAVPTAILTAAVLLGSCGGSGGEADPDQFTGSPLELQDPGAVHVHGMGYDRRRKILYLATHTGMFELPDGATRAERIADNYQDTMGFTLVGPDMFLGSGHPDAREELPPLLGLIRSTDQGRTWTSVSLLGEADFHVLRSNGRTVYGFDSSNKRLLASNDAGHSWQKRSAPEALLDLAVDPSAPQHLLASGGAVLYRSQDGGHTWHAAVSGIGGYLAWPSTKRIFVATLDGGFLSAESDTGPWRARESLGSPVAALLAVGERTLFAALHDGTIKESHDGGVSWKVRARP